MDFLESLELSVNTLLLFFVVPFCYFGYHSKYWYRPDLLKRWDFLLSALACGLAVFIFLKIIRFSTEHDPELVKLAILHLAPLVLTLLIVSQGRGLMLRMPQTAGSRGEKKGKDYVEYTPVPLNQQVEQISWDDLIIDQNLRQELISVMELLRDPKTAKKYGIDVPKGILLSGPPGTGKTTIAKVIASTANLSFFVLKMDEVVSKWVGESEKNLSKLFDAASRYAPAVIFVDEVDSIGRSRSDSSQRWADNLLNHLLQLVDGVVKAEGIYIIAATNRPDLVDSALIRAGRLNKIIEVPLPDFEGRLKLFSLYLSKLKLEEGLDLNILSEVTEGKSGADIKAICNQAGLNAFKRETGGKKRDYVVSLQDLELALNEFVG